MIRAWAEFISGVGVPCRSPRQAAAGLGEGVGLVGDARPALGWGRKRRRPPGLQRALLATGGDAALADFGQENRDKHAPEGLWHVGS